MPRNHARLLLGQEHPVLGVAGAAIPPLADSWLRDSKFWQVLHEEPDSMGSPGTRFSYAGVATTKVEHM